MIEFIKCFMRPFQVLRDELEIRRLRKQLPSVHTRLVTTPHGVTRESRSAYLDRLRDIYDERGAVQARSESRSATPT